MNEITQKAKAAAVSDDTVQEIVKQKRTRPDLTERNSVHTEPGDNRKFMQHALHMWNWKRPDMNNAEAVTDRIQQYFQLCVDDDMKPSVEGMAVAFEADRKQLWRWANNVECTIAPDARHSIKKAYDILTLQMTDFMQNGKINPVVGIWLMKNNMDYKDQSEVLLTPNNPLGSESSAEEAQKRLESDLPIEGELAE